ncbi:LrgB family protein [Vagococcus silagei]|uniref:LrgB family protein n=1 Tax=Vagococcus silagei TaxID=2508885 RepID=A0A4S3B1M4_9ENTE|nr:LrgB family protein [Vagococcus silagei]THB60127.1 LrgB family protein [Vagococcus silagei]
MFNDLLKNPLLWITLTLGFYLLASKLKEKWPSNPLFTPLAFTMIVIIAILLIFNIPLETYQSGGKYFSLFITPATVSLAISLEKNFDYLRRYFPAILSGIFLGVLFHTILIYLFAVVFHFDKKMVITLIPKSITTAIAVGVSDSLGGIVSLTVGIVIITGVIGAVIGPAVLKTFGVVDPVAQGIALGSSAHAIGTSRAIEMGEVQGAMSGLAIVVTGVMIVALAPIAVKFAEFII